MAFLREVCPLREQYSGGVHFYNNLKRIYDYLHGQWHDLFVVYVCSSSKTRKTNKRRHHLWSKVIITPLLWTNLQKRRKSLLCLYKRYLAWPNYSHSIINWPVATINIAMIYETRTQKKIMSNFWFFRLSNNPYTNKFQPVTQQWIPKGGIKKDHKGWRKRRSIRENVN